MTHESTKKIFMCVFLHVQKPHVRSSTLFTDQGCPLFKGVVNMPEIKQTIMLGSLYNDLVNYYFLIPFAGMTLCQIILLRLKKHRACWDITRPLSALGPQSLSVMYSKSFEATV